MVPRCLPIAVILALLVGTGCVAKDMERTAADVLGGEDVVKAIRSAKKVEVYRLKAQSVQRKPDEYAATAGPMAVKGDVAAELAETLIRFDTYEREVAVGCEPQFGMRTTFTSGDTVIDIVYCFECDTLVVYRNGDKVGDGLFIPAHRKLVASAKRLLPKDEVIQGLK